MMKLVSNGASTGSKRLSDVALNTTDKRDEYPVYTIVASTLTNIGSTMQLQYRIDTDASWMYVTDATLNATDPGRNLIMSPNCYVQIADGDIPGTYAGDVDIA